MKMGTVASPCRHDAIALPVAPRLQVFRHIEDERPTLLIDEAITFISDDEEMRGVLNSGHTKAAADVIHTYIPHIEDAIWHEFSGPLLRPKRLLWDAEQSKQLTLQVCELNVEDLHGLAVLDELVSLSEAE